MWHLTCTPFTTWFHDHGCSLVSSLGSTVDYASTLSIVIESPQPRVGLLPVSSTAMSSTIAIPTARSSAAARGQSPKTCASSSSSFSSSPQTPVSANSETPESPYKRKAMHHRRQSLLSTSRPFLLTLLAACIAPALSPPALVRVHVNMLTRLGTVEGRVYARQCGRSRWPTAAGERSPRSETILLALTVVICSDFVSGLEPRLCVEPRNVPPFIS